jgi:amino acid permease
VLASICLAFVALQSVICGVFILEACARAEMLKVSMSEASFQDQGQALESGDLAVGQTHGSKARRFLPRAHSLRVHQRTFELSELCRIFMGRWLRNFFTATTSGDLYGITWTLAIVFGSSLSEHLPLGTDRDHMLYIVIFMVVAVPLSCMRITAQMTFQVMFLLARTIMLLLMVGTLIAAYVSNDSHFGTQDEPSTDTPIANFSSIVTVLQLCIFSTAYQFAVPSVTSETKDKGAMVGIIGRSVTYIYATNIIVCLLVAGYFGTATESSANLNWLKYHGGTWDGEGDFTRSWWATAISSYIVLFAALDGLAVYPLICISLGDILMGACYEDKVHDMQENWKVRIAFRLLASVPQAIGSMFLTDLGIVYVDLSGEVLLARSLVTSTDLSCNNI